MCGIFITNSQLINKEHEPVLIRALGFRGPDFSSGLIKHGNWKVYHSRLAILGLTNESHQPIINPDGSVLVFNGEILNFKYLGKKYFNRVYTSDTLLLNDLIRHNVLRLTELDGFFSFVFVNGSGQVEFACRDKFGVKPLFYFERNGEIAFSSEASALKTLFNCSVNFQAIEEYRYFRAPIFQKSFFNGVCEVEPGHCLITGRYFDLMDELDVETRSPSMSELENALQNSVKSRCIADVPIALLLSAGIDSNLIKATSDIKNFYTIGMQGDLELEYFKNQKIQGQSIYTVTAEEFKQAFSYLLHLKQEPLSVPNEVLLYLIGVKARKDGVKVLLSGEGADEFFAGYDRIFSWAKMQKNLLIEEFAQLYCYGREAPTNTIKQALSEAFESCFLSSVFEKVRWFFIKFHLPVLLRRLDFSLMAAGVEGREPIANQHMFDLCKGLSSDVLIHKQLGKNPLRKLASRYFGDEFGYAQKIGFPVDMRQVYQELNSFTSYEIWFNKNIEVLS